MVETNLDIHHTPFVHKWSVPGLGAVLKNFTARLEGNRIYTKGQLCKPECPDKYFVDYISNLPPYAALTVSSGCGMGIHKVLIRTFRFLTTLTL